MVVSCEKHGISVKGEDFLNELRGQALCSTEFDKHRPTVGFRFRVSV
jgi:hypothetical protein